jgi:phage/plasmid-like protein (TIGR03299 family)
MSHLVETMAWANTVPWHGLGVKVDDNLNAQDMLKAAKLDWTVSRRPLFHGAEGDTSGTGSMDNVGDFFGLVRDSDNKVLDVIGNRYLPTQNVQAFEFFQEFVHAGSAKMDTAGSLRGGRIVWGLASLQQSFTLPGKDKVNGYLLVALPHEQGKAIQVKFTTVRVVCNNTITMALRGKSEFRMSHRSLFDAKAQESAKVALGIARDQMAEQQQIAEQLVATKISRDDELMLMAKLFHDELIKEGVAVVRQRVADGDINKKMAIACAALDRAPGQKMESALGTAWGTLNACTYAVDHQFGRGADQRLTKAWFGNGATVKAKAMAELIKA